MISFDDFAKVELKIGTILTAQAVEGSQKLIRCTVDLGEDEPRQILAGVRKWYKPDSLIGRQVVIAANLEPRVMMGFQSQGMMLAAGEEKPVFLKPSAKVSPGSKVG